MSNLLIAFIFGIGAGGWSYNKTYKRTGGNRQTSWIVSGVVGLFGLIVLWSVLSLLFSSDS